MHCLAILAHLIVKELSLFDFQVNREKCTAKVQEVDLDAAHYEVVDPQSVQFRV
jgi:hypothetical protein